MSDVNLSNIDNLLYELRTPMQKNYRRKHVLQAELKRIAPSERFDGGNKGRIPIILNELQGAGNPGETGTINVPHNWNTTKAEFTLENNVMPIGITLDAEEDSVDNSAAEQIALLVAEARNSLASHVNDQFNYEGGLLATIDGGSSGSLVVEVDPAVTTWDALYPGRVVDVLTRSTGADAGQGKRRKIASRDRSAGTITFSTTQQASDGGSGNITFSTASGIYLPGTYGNALNSLHDIADDTDESFLGIDRGDFPGWAAVDGREGVSATKMMSTTMLDAAFALAGENGDEATYLGLARPQVINGFKQQHYAMLRYNPKDVTLSAGHRAIEYVANGKPVAFVSEQRFKRAKCVLVPKEDVAIYHGRNHAGGPSFDKQTGSMWQRFSRALPKEAWLRDKLQLVPRRCNRTIFLHDLDEAA